MNVFHQGFVYFFADKFAEEKPHEIYFNSHVRLVLSPDQGMHELIKLMDLVFRLSIIA